VNATRDPGRSGGPVSHLTEVMFAYQAGAFDGRDLKPEPAARPQLQLGPDADPANQTVAFDDAHASVALDAYSRGLRLHLPRRRVSETLCALERRKRHGTERADRPTESGTSE